ncbi:MAG TPA: hypothetical protein VIK72_15455 [Clostridiaceae bacterium]
MNIGVIDIGSNSIRLIIGEIINKDFNILDDHKEIIRLGDLGEDNKLKDIQMLIALTVLKNFKEIINNFNEIDIICVATEAVRKAVNGDYFIKRVKETTGLNIKILTGEEEAYYEYVSSIKSNSINSGYIMDVGGGSTELIRFEDRRLKESISLPYGALNLTLDYSLYDLIGTSSQNEIRMMLYKEFNKYPWLNRGDNSFLVGMGGSFRAISKIHSFVLGKTYISENYEVASKDIKNIYNSIKKMSRQEKMSLDAISKERGEIIAGGIIIILAALDYLEKKTILISKYGIREGLIYDYIEHL